MYKAILFDLDGTLTDSGEGIMKSVQYALEKIGKPEPELEKLRAFVGPPLMNEFMEYAGVDQETAEKAVQYYRERYAPVGIYENSLYPGVEDMLIYLKKKGYLLGVASSKPEYFVKKILAYFKLEPYFDQAVGSELNGQRVKKSDVIEEILRRFGLEAHRDQVLMVGDRKYDVYGARELGMDCLAVTYGYGSQEELEEAKPLKIVHNTEEILDFFC